MYNEEERGTVICGVIVAVDERKLEIQGGREKSGKVGTKGGAGGEKAEGLHEEDQEEGQKGPEGDDEGEEDAGGREKELYSRMVSKTLYKIYTWKDPERSWKLDIQHTNNCTAFSSGAFSLYSAVSYTAVTSGFEEWVLWERGVRCVDATAFSGSVCAGEGYE